MIAVMTDTTNFLFMKKVWQDQIDLFESLCKWLSALMEGNILSQTDAAFNDDLGQW